MSEPIKEASKRQTVLPSNQHESQEFNGKGEIESSLYSSDVGNPTSTAQTAGSTAEALQSKDKVAETSATRKVDRDHDFEKKNIESSLSSSHVGDPTNTAQTSGGIAETLPSKDKAVEASAAPNVDGDHGFEKKNDDASNPSVTIVHGSISKSAKDNTSNNPSRAVSFAMTIVDPKRIDEKSKSHEKVPKTIVQDDSLLPIPTKRSISEITDGEKGIGHIVEPGQRQISIETHANEIVGFKEVDGKQSELVEAMPRNESSQASKQMKASTKTKIGGGPATLLDPISKKAEVKPKTSVADQLGEMGRYSTTRIKQSFFSQHEQVNNGSAFSVDLLDRKRERRDKSLQSSDQMLSYRYGVTDGKAVNSVSVPERRQEKLGRELRSDQPGEDQKRGEVAESMAVVDLTVSPTAGGEGAVSGDSPAFVDQPPRGRGAPTNQKGVEVSGMSSESGNVEADSSTPSEGDQVSPEQQAFAVTQRGASTAPPKRNVQQYEISGADLGESQSLLPKHKPMKSAIQSSIKDNRTNDARQGKHIDEIVDVILAGVPAGSTHNLEKTDATRSSDSDSPQVARKRKISALYSSASGTRSKDADASRTSSTEPQSIIDTHDGIVGPNPSSQKPSESGPRSTVQSTWLPSNFQLRPGFEQQNLTELIQATGDWYAIQNGQRKRIKTRFLPIQFNELSASAIARWAAHDVPNQSTRPTIDRRFRICTSCKKIGHYEAECPVLPREAVMRLAIECSNEPLVISSSNYSIDDAKRYDVVVETCGGFLIEQRATEEKEVIQRGNDTDAFAKTSTVTDVDGFKIRSAKTEIGLKDVGTVQDELRRAFESEADSKLLLDDVVVWEPPFGTKNESDHFTGNVCVGVIQEIARDTKKALVKVIRTLPPSCETRIPSEVKEVLPTNDSLLWIPLSKLYLNAEEWAQT